MEPTRLAARLLTEVVTARATIAAGFDRLWRAEHRTLTGPSNGECLHGDADPDAVVAWQDVAAREATWRTDAGADPRR